jgi:hypothetical protein
MASSITSQGRLTLSTLVAIGAIAAAGSTVKADARAFTFTYETTTMPPGEVEYEQWITWSTHKDSDSTYDRFEFRHEIEFGVTDNFQLAFYLADWRYQDGDSVADDGTDYRGSYVEAIYSLTDPVEDFLGIALYGEAGGGDEFLKTEFKLLLQKNIGPFIIAWNGILEAEWEGERYTEDIGELGQTLGISYQIHPSFLVGLEAVHEVEIEDWEDSGDHVLYLGPNFSYRSKKWWITVSPLFETTDIADEPHYKTRIIFGIFF